MDIYSTIASTGILPVICLKNENELETFTKAIIKTPIRCFEITMRHPFSYKAIEFFKKEYPEFIVGAGTVVNSDILNSVVELGVDYCVSPGFDEKIVFEASEKGVPFIPGCATPTEILKAQSLGVSTVKLFPAECFGGVDALKLYESAFSGISFLPTGGITMDNYKRYLSCSNTLACGGSFMIPKDLLHSGDAEGITDTVNKCIASAREVIK